MQQMKTNNQSVTVSTQLLSPTTAWEQVQSGVISLMSQICLQASRAEPITSITLIRNGLIKARTTKRLKLADKAVRSCYNNDAL